MMQNTFLIIIYDDINISYTYNMREKLFIETNI